MLFKICKRCGEEKEENSFYRDSKSKDGFRSICKECETDRHETSAKARWKEIHSEKGIRYYNYRASKLKHRADGNVTGEFLLRLVEDSGKSCFFCGESTEDFHFDHKLPVSRGGSSDEDNIQICCSVCNLMKRDMSSDEFISYTHKISNRFK